MEQIKTPYGLEDHLGTVCQQAPQFKDLVSSWVLNKRSCATALKQVAQNYPHYSVHDELHAKNVISNMEQILGEDRICKLSPTDTWMLLQLAYLHDFGMLLLYEKVEAEWAGEDFQEYLQECRESNNPSVKQAADYLSNLKEHLQDDDFEKNWPVQVRRYVTYLISSYYRGKHADLSNQYILSMIQNWGIDLSHNGLIQSRLIKLLGQLSMLHTRDKEDVLAQDYMSNGYSADYIHPRFLAEMLRLGDLLDVDNSRFEPAAEKVTGSLPDDSARHRKKHEATVHLLITPEQIEYRADCPDHPAYREARVFLDWLEDELTFSAIHWLGLIPKGFGGSAPRLTKKELLLNGKPDIENTSGLRFMMSQEKAFEIIEGSGIYSDKMVFLRELIQNAEDASKIQLWRDLQRRPGLYLQPHANADDLSHIQPYDLKPEAFDSYKITVDIERGPDDRFRIRVIDRGTGMNADTVKQMCNVGASYHQDKARRREIESMPAWLRPTAGFGIGLQSVFLVAPTFTMYSRTEKGGIKVTVESRKREGYVQVEEDDSWEEQGTCIEIYIGKIDYLKGHRALNMVSGLLDEFTPDGDPRFQYIIDQLNFMGSVFFDIQVLRGQKLSLVVYRNSFGQFCLKDAEAHGNCLIHQLENGGIALWDTKEHIYCKIHCIMTLEKSEIKFKGKTLYERRAIIPSYQNSRFVMNVDCYGFDAKTYLSLDRTHFQVKKIQSVRMNIDYLLQSAVDFLLEKENLQTVLGADRSIFNRENTDSYHVDSYYLLWQIANKAQKRIMLDNPERYLDHISTEIPVLTWSEGGYLFSKCKVGEIIENIERFCFLYQLHHFKIDESCIQIVYEDNIGPVDIFLSEFN